LKDPISGNALEDEQKTINDMGLVPAAVLRFEWDPDVFAELNRQGQQVPYLSDHFMQEAEKFVAS
uniref:ABC transporter substrate-binding protein n=1 Tax=Anisakis simplex TaxID=6269 RepID=A0A0M3KK23_ANISI